MEGKKEGEKDIKQRLTKNTFQKKREETEEKFHNKSLAYKT